MLSLTDVNFLYTVTRGTVIHRKYFYGSVSLLPLASAFTVCLCLFLYIGHKFFLHSIIFHVDVVLSCMYAFDGMRCYTSIPFSFSDFYTDLSYHRFCLCQIFHSFGFCFAHILIGELCRYNCFSTRHLTLGFYLIAEEFIRCS